MTSLLSLVRPSNVKVAQPVIALCVCAAQFALIPAIVWELPRILTKLWSKSLAMEMKITGSSFIISFCNIQIRTNEL